MHDNLQPGSVVILLSPQIAAGIQYNRGTLVTLDGIDVDEDGRQHFNLRSLGGAAPGIMIPAVSPFSFASLTYGQRLTITFKAGCGPHRLMPEGQPHDHYRTMVLRNVSEWKFFTNEYGSTWWNFESDLLSNMAIYAADTIEAIIAEPESEMLSDDETRMNFHQRRFREFPEDAE